ncbi:PspC domain-containing protein [Corynebacterium qintianiae]|uniref:PspC domain-containing protein n=1 Tax=Corynebacterium qintianiae TaxID=2709392 RepID=A0A7T0PF79_9CORY|nr:PspC domain-containing protein [Corynebacterium qintianiae]QPK84001.1 PspC domain-containing protein [Corynebacterium qintianiae]
MSTNSGFTPNSRKRLTRSLTDRWIAGVCGGIAQYFKLDPVLVRLIFVVLALAGVLPGVALYIIAWIIMPEGV